MSVIVAFLFAISLWYLSSNHKVTFVKLKATDLKFLPNRSWHGLIPAGGTFVSATGGTFQSDTPGTFVSAMGGTFDSDIPGTFESATGGTFNPLLSDVETVKEAILNTKGFEPIQLCKFGSIYFIDGGGNHRVCQAKFLELETVPCEVTEYVLVKDIQ